MADSWLVGSRKRYCPSDLPLRSIPPTALRLWAPPAYGRGWPGSAGQHRIRPYNFNPFLLRCASLVGPAYGRGWPGSFRTTPPTTLQLQSITPPLRFTCEPRPLTAAGGQGPSGQHRLRPCNFNPLLLRCAEGHGNRPWRLALVALSVVSSHPR